MGDRFDQGAMLARGGYHDQDILAFFTRPSRSINHARIAEIRTGSKYKAAKIATEEELDQFLVIWPNVDPETGLNLRGEELLIKAREAMIAAVHVFNGAGLVFRAELFIVTCIIAWTYLLHAWFRREGINYRYKRANGTVQKTKQGADSYWELGKCLRHARCPLARGAVKILELLLALRHEIEHRATSRIDDAIGAKLQACCLNFNEAIKSLFGAQHGLERRLPIALQFFTFSADQRTALKKSSDLPAHVEAFIDAFEHGLTEEEYADPAYRYRIAFVPISRSRASSADVAVQFVRKESDDGREVNRVLLKEVERHRYIATQVWKLMQAEGYPDFDQQAHTALWKELHAKDPDYGYGRKGDYKDTWVWYDKWIERVRTHCEEHEERYRRKR